MKYEPPSGSAVSVVPASAARICCVRSAIVAERSVGRASASSKEFVCSDCAPPQTAESAWIATRTMLFSGCWAVSVEPPVCAWKRRAMSAWVRGPEAVAHDLGPQASRRSELRDLLEEVVVRVEEERESLAEVVG